MIKTIFKGEILVLCHDVHIIIANKRVIVLFCLPLYTCVV